MTENTKKPSIRFKGFTDAWEQRKLGDIADRVVRKNSNLESTLPLTISAQYGLVDQVEYFSNRVASRDVSGYYLVKNGEFAYNKSYSDGYPYGAIKRLDMYKMGVLSTLYIVFAIKSKEIDSEYLVAYYETSKWHRQVAERAAEGARNHGLLNISATDFFETKLKYPFEIGEQSKIGTLFKQLDNLITLHQRKYHTKKEVNSRVKLMSKLTYWTNAWEQRKFSESVEIERGGSPRPIDEYITNEPNGLNWIKIGDAPEQGNVIVKTAEKIKPSGLSKTRQVQIGDLILSNSMSFGKPYIMGINGCIHDGWLLIRDVQGAFDLLFLCQLLGTDQMLRQYKARAAGSTVNNLNKELVGNTLITVPTKQEQHKLGGLFQKIDNLITLHQRR